MAKKKPTAIQNTHTTMNAIIKPTELLPGDVLLYHGTAFMSKLIMLFDGGDYSHASVYTGTKIAEAIGEGIVGRDVKTSVAGAKFVDVYRFISAGGKHLREPDYADASIVARAEYYLARKELYAYEAILLLAFLASTRRLPVVGWIPGLGKIVRTILDNAAELLNQLIKGKKEPMICSELVYRCYGEAAGDKYKLKIIGADALRAQSAQAFAALAAAAPGPLTSEQQDALETQDAIQDFLAKYAVAKQVNAAPGEISALAVPDFVTPRDLQRSSNLYKAGALQI